ncbi:MAG: hypothetical protein GX291_03440 [Tissierellia bacterium]|nr:hypothetical protein [Tissierellia bacterium]
MSSPNRSYRVVQAGPEHDAGMARLLEESAFDGPIAVSYRRRPSVIASYKKEADEGLLYVLLHGPEEAVVGMGAVTIRSIWLNGRWQRMAYLSGLRITPAHQKAFLLIPRMYERMYQSTKDQVDLYLTTIVSDNTDVIRMFEKKRRAMPEYRFETELETYLIGSKPVRKEAQIRPQERKTNGCADPAWLAARGARFFGTGENYGYLLKPYWKQYHIKSYRGAYRLLSVLPTEKFFLPRFPKPGTDASYLAAGVYADHDMPRIVDTLRRQTPADFLMLSAVQGSPLAAHLKRLTPVVYRTRLYQVLFHEAEPQDLRGLAVDVSFL